MGSLRSFLPLVLPPSGMNRTPGGSKSVYLRPDPMPFDLWMELVMTCLQGQTLESNAMRQATDWRRFLTAKKKNRTNTSLSFTTLFSNFQKQKLELCTDHAAGRRKHSVSSSVESSAQNLRSFFPSTPSLAPNRLGRRYPLNW